jgi:hypothetical protein
MSLPSFTAHMYGSDFRMKRKIASLNRSAAGKCCALSLCRLQVTAAPVGRVCPTYGSFACPGYAGRWHRRFQAKRCDNDALFADVRSSSRTWRARTARPVCAVLTRRHPRVQPGDDPCRRLEMIRDIPPVCVSRDGFHESCQAGDPCGIILP